MTPDQWLEIKHFKPEEFDSPDLAGSGKLMDYEFMKLLDLIREDCGFPFMVNSGFRTIVHNAELTDSVDGSEHCSGKGADISAPTSRQRFKIVQSAIKYGITRVGIGKRFVHLGTDTTKPVEVIWLY